MHTHFHNRPVLMPVLMPVLTPTLAPAPAATFASVFGSISTSTCIVLTVLAALTLPGCDRSNTATAQGIRQTGFPGQVSAGGETGGRIIARAAKTAPSTPAVVATQAPQEGTRGQSPTGSVAGTPSIPEGSGGTTSGAEMGGTTPSAAATRQAPAPGGGAPTVPSQESRK